MSWPVNEISVREFPLLREIPEPPKQLFYRGTLPSREIKLLSVVGSRKYTTYGKQVIDYLIDGLRNYPVGIVSGLALGVDSLSHEAALKNGMYTMAIPGSGINDSVIYPARHKPLARRILENNGCMLTEFKPDFVATKWSFTQRNRIMAGIAHATLLIEAAEKSGTLITARLATDFNRDLLVVPGDIFSQNSRGVHQFLKLGATPVTSAEDILLALGIDQDKEPQKAKLFAADNTLSPNEQKVISALSEPTDRDTLIRTCGLSSADANALLMQMEIKGLISSEQNIYRRLM